jgi:hypothetical protein
VYVCNPVRILLGVILLVFPCHGLSSDGRYWYHVMGWNHTNEIILRRKVSLCLNELWGEDRVWMNSEAKTVFEWTLRWRPQIWITNNRFIYLHYKRGIVKSVWWEASQFILFTSFCSGVHSEGRSMWHGVSETRNIYRLLVRKPEVKITSWKNGPLKLSCTAVVQDTIDRWSTVIAAMKLRVL